MKYNTALPFFPKVELQLGQVRLQVLVVCRVNRVDAAEHHWLDLLEAGQRA